MSVWVDVRLKNMLFMLEVVYREHEFLQDMANTAIQNITQLLEQLDSDLQDALMALPEVKDSQVSVGYSHPKIIEISCSTPQARIYVSLLQHYDLIVQQCDLLWLTGHWSREESRGPVRYWSRAISKGLYNCAGYFLPLQRKYIQYQKSLRQPDNEPSKNVDQP